MSEADHVPPSQEDGGVESDTGALTPNKLKDASDQQDDVDVDGGVPPYEDRLGPDGAEGENPVIPQATVERSDEPNQDDSQEDENYDSLPDNGLERAGGQVLPWGAPKERARFPSTVHIETDIKPGEFVMRTLFAEFTIQAEKKITAVMNESLERPLSKSLQRGEDPHFDQILAAFGSVAEHCLPSILKTMIAWYERQGVEWIVSEYKPSKSDSKGRSELSHVSEQEFVSERRDLAVEFIFCLVLIEVLRQLHFHPGHEDLVHYIENLCFKHFKYRGPGETLGPNAASIHSIADLYAEVLGVMAANRFQSVRKRFTHELRELRSKESTPQTVQSIISLLMGMKFFRVKMVPIEEFEDSFQFMQECAAYFLEVRDKDIKHAMAGLFVEILVPVAASVKNEVNVPCLKNFVEMLYSQTLDMCTKSKHRLALFPLVTCLLCVSQKPFFLHNWHYFLTMCLQHLKNKDPKLSRVALESLYRLLWVYMIRIKCESNNVTQSRLQSIVNSLFPKGSKTVVPRDTPLNIFVKIIQFISQEKLDFSMREIIFDLLSVGRPIKFINAPERMSIGLRAFLVIADSLQQKEGEPPMPRTVSVMPSGSTLRVKKTFLNKMLTEDAAKTIGINPYYPYVRKVFDDILRALDAQFGKPFMLTHAVGVKSDADDAKPKLDLFRTVIAAIPRLIPDGMSRSELVETLSRLTVHTDDEIRALSCQALQNLVIDFADWREDVLWGFMQFVMKEVTDLHPNLLDNSLRMINNLLGAWKGALEKVATSTVMSPIHNQDPTRPDPEKPDLLKVLYNAEALALTMLCNLRLTPRKLAVHILREVKFVLKLSGISERCSEIPVIDVMDACTRDVVEACANLLPVADKSSIANTNDIDMQWLAERSSAHWTAGFHDDGTARSGSNQQFFAADPWSACLLGFLEYKRLPKSSPSAILHTWPLVHTRLTQLYSTVNPIPVQDQRSSLFPGTAPKKPANERDIWLHLWKNYIAMACRVVPTIQASSTNIRCVSPDLSLTHLSSSPESLLLLERVDSRSQANPMLSPSVMYKLIIPLLRCEVADMRDSVVQALGNINHHSLMDLLSEKVMQDYIREAIDRKAENRARRRRVRDSLRLQLVRVFELIAQHGTFSRAKGVIDDNTDSLSPIFIEYISGVRELLENDNDKDLPKEIKLHFQGFITQLIGSFPLDKRRTLIRKELRKHLFNLFAGWAGRYGHIFGISSRPSSMNNSTLSAASAAAAAGSSSGPPPVPAVSEAEFSALQAMLSVLCSGPNFDQSKFAEEGDVYKLLDMLLASDDPRIYDEGRKAVVMLLEVNPDLSQLLDWVVDRCYTGSNRQADGCFLALATIFSTREYPCDHYTAIINVTLMNCGCPRTAIHETALQLLQILDHRFFGTRLPLDNDEETAGMSAGNNGNFKERSTLDVLLSTTYSRSQLYLSRQLSQLHPELTMPMFSEISSRLQTARPAARQNLLQYLLPWLYNMELVDPNIPPHPSNYHYPYYQSFEMGRPGVRREGWGSAEATEMVTNNMFYLTCKFGDEHPKEIEELWAALCACWPNNLRVIVRYLLIVLAMAPNKVLDYAKRVVLYLGRSQPVRTLDELMLELQSVETFNVIIERTETPPYYRLTNLRKASSNLDNNNIHSGNSADNSGHNTIASSGSNRQDLAETKGTIHTKRHSQEDHGGTHHGPAGKEKLELSLAGSLRSAGSMATSAGNAIIQKVAEKARALSGTQQHIIMSQSQIVTSSSGVGGSSGVMSSSHASPATWKQTMTTTTTSANSDSLLTAAAAAEEHISLGRGALQDQDQSGDPSGDSIDITGDANEAGLPHPLPMPEFGGWFAPLTEFLPDASCPISSFHRCNLAVILLTDLVVDGLDLDCHSVDWSIHMPLMLHIVFLGLDNSRPIVHYHCKQLLLNLLLVLGCHNDHLSVAGVLLNNKTTQMNYGLVTAPSSSVINHNFLEEDEKFDSYLSYLNTNRGDEESDEDEEEDDSQASGSPSVTSGHGSMSSSRSSAVTFSLPSPGVTVSEATKALIQFLSSKTEGVLWQYEDTTKSLSTIKSAQQIEIFLRHVLRLFEESLPQARLAERWAQLSIQLALSCSSRHYAGRSLQIFRALRVPITSRVLTDILSRLVETIAEQGEDMQGYVTELMLTLEAVVETLDSDFRPMDIMKEIFKSTPNLNKEGSVFRPGGVGGGGGGAGPAAPSPLQHAYHVSAPPTGPYHARSTSYSMSPHNCRRPNPSSSPGPGEPRGRSSTESESKLRNSTNLARSRSAQSLKMQDQASHEDKMNILVQLFWICIAILESDYEHEFLLGLRLLDKVLTKLPLDRPDAREKVEKILSGLKWPHFPGLHSLLLKGCTHPNTYEASIALISRLTLQLDFVVVDPSQNLAFPMNVIALLPYLVMNYEEANELCITSARNIAQVSTEKSKKLENLSTVMTLYSRRTFSKESFQWTKCVVKYLYDSYSHLSLTMLGFLVEVLEKGPPSVQPSVLTIIHCMAHYVDLQSTTQSINSDLLRAVSKFVETPHWKEALKILKLAVTRSSTLVAPPSTSSHSSHHHHHHWEAHASFAEPDVYFKKELPGRTMEFTYDLSQTPVIERRQRRGGLSHYGEDGSNATSPRRSLSLSTADSANFSGWKRPWMSQGRVRECLVNLLNTCGQKVGLPKSPSVIFSQTSELLERQSSMASSTECVSGPGNDVSTEQSKHDTTDTEQKFGMYMKDFDFLEYELESLEGESVDNFNWGVRRPSIANLDGEGGSITGSLTARRLTTPGNTSPVELRRAGGLVSGIMAAGCGLVSGSLHRGASSSCSSLAGAGSAGMSGSLRTGVMEGVHKSGRSVSGGRPASVGGSGPPTMAMASSGVGDKGTTGGQVQSGNVAGGGMLPVRHKKTSGGLLSSKQRAGGGRHHHQHHHHHHGASSRHHDDDDDEETTDDDLEGGVSSVSPDLSLAGRTSQGEGEEVSSSVSTASSGVYPPVNSLPLDLDRSAAAVAGSAAVPSSGPTSVDTVVSATAVSEVSVGSSTGAEGPGAAAAEAPAAAGAAGAPTGSGKTAAAGKKAGGKSGSSLTRHHRHRYSSRNHAARRAAGLPRIQPRRASTPHTDTESGGDEEEEEEREEDDYDEDDIDEEDEIEEEDDLRNVYAVEDESEDEEDGEMSDVTPCNPSPSLSQLLSWSGCTTSGMRDKDDVEENWRHHVQSLMSSASQENLLLTFTLFAKLFRELRSRTVSLTEETCQFLSQDDRNMAYPGHADLVITITVKFRDLLGVLSTVPDCPHVWCDFDLVADPRLTERIKFSVLEIQENFENYVDKKETTVTCLDTVRTHSRILASGDTIITINSYQAEKVELCRFLYKLHFQQVLMLESYSKLLQLLSGAASENGAEDLSVEVCRIRVGLLTSQLAAATSLVTATYSPPVSPKMNRPGDDAEGAAADSGSGQNTINLTEDQDSVQQGEESEVSSVVKDEAQEEPADVGSRPPSASANRPASGLDSHPISAPGSRPGSAIGSRPGSSTSGKVGDEAEPSPPPFEDQVVEGDAEEPADKQEDQEQAPETEQQQEIEVSVQPPQDQATEVETVTTADTDEVIEVVSEPVLPANLEDAKEQLVDLLTASKWTEAWRLWRGCRTILMQDQVSQPHQEEAVTVAEDEVTHILNIYCKYRATKQKGLFVMTLRSKELTTICSSLMDLSLQLLGSVKTLESNLAQNASEGNTKV